MTEYLWVTCTPDWVVPSTALRGGTDMDGAPIFVGRALHEGGWIPAKVIPDKSVAYVSYGGAEHAKQECQVLCEQHFEWVPSSDGNVPPDAVSSGTSGGEILYIGRVHHSDSVTVGKVHPSHGVCYIPFDGNEVASTNYEVLVLKT